jgi:segregation and condensation protein A
MTAGEYTVSLPVFEGPLDLLLHLVKKHELDVLDIPVAFITEKYLAYLDLMRQTNLDIAGEYLLMAATLVHLKSRELLPSPEPLAPEEGEGDEELDPRQELIRRLLEYQKYREAAEKLDEMPVTGRNVWTRGASLDGGALDLGSASAPLAEVSVFKLLECLADVLAKSRVKLTHEVVVDRLSITDRINQLVDRLEAEGTFTFTSCFALPEGAEMGAAQLKHDVVVTFLAILEMTRLKLIHIYQPQPVPPDGGDAPAPTPTVGGPAEIFVTRAVAAGVAQRAKEQQ